MAKENKNYPQLHIQLLEPRIMFDGAAIYSASEALDMIGDQQSFQIDEKNLSSDLNPIIENSNSRKEIVFIDSGVDNYQTIVDAIDSSKSIYLIDSNENGFDKMQNALQGQSDVDAVHIIGHASAGQVVLGNSILNADTINSFSNTLQSIGNSLTPDGDLLFYGCNLAQGEQGKLLIQQIGNITQADIAASDDVTGKDGDWLLEVEKGIIEAKSLEVNHYDSNLVSLAGVSSSSGFVVESGTNLYAGQNAEDTASNASNHTDGYKPYVVALERENLTTGSFNFYKQSITGTGFEESNSGVDNNNSPDITSNTTAVTASTSNPLNVYYIMATESTGRSTVRSITFDGEIVGVWFNMENIIEYSSVDKDGATYHTISQHGNGSQNAFSTENLKTNWGTNITINSKPTSGGQAYKSDWFGVDTDSNTLYVGFNNNSKHGDIIRVFTKSGNNAPVGRNDDGVVNEDATLTVSDGANKSATGSYDTNGEHSGDVIHTSNTDSYDTDADGDTLTVNAVRVGSTEGSGTTGTVGTALTGTYGRLTLNSNGSYTYVADQSAADALDAGDVVYDYFNYDVYDGSADDTAVITIRVIGVNDDVTAVNDYGVVTEDATLTVTNGESQNLSGSYDTHDEHSGDISANDTDPDASPTHTITAIRTGSTEGSGTAGSIGSALTGTYGQLTLAADGSYTYVANQDAADALDVNDTISDYFNYTVSDGTDTDTGVIRIYILGANDTPVAQNDEGLIAEGSTLTVSNGANANVSGSYDASLEHTGDVMDTSSSSHSDSDADASASLSITGIRTGQESGSGTSGSVGSSLTGTYGALTINSNGSYSYAANSSISGLGEGDTVIDYFTYTVSDGSATDTAQLKITVIGVGNTKPVALNDVGVILEDGTLTVSDGDNANETSDSGTTYNATGEHSGDVINTSSTTHYDTDADGDTLIVSEVRTGNTEDAGTAGTIGSALTGTYGQLTLNANGSYIYVANQTAADALDDGDIVYDYFNYTVDDQTGAANDEDHGLITITVIGINDDPVAQDDVGVIVEGSTLTVANGDNANETNDSGSTFNATGEHSGDVIDTSSSSHTDSDADASATLSISHIKLSGGSNSTVASSSSYNSNGTQIVGTYGTLTIGADGSYTYAATTAAADALDTDESGTDTFVYTLKDDQDAITTANLTITVLGANDAPVARNDSGTIVEDGTLTVNDGDGTSTISGASLVDGTSVRTEENDPRGLAFNNDGTKMFILGFTGKDVTEYTLSTAFDASTATYVSGGELDISSQESEPSGIEFNNDGTKLFIVGTSGDDVTEYTLSTAFDVSTASHVSGGEKDLSSQDLRPRDLTFNSDGTKMIVVGDAGETIEEYNLSTAFDVSTASHDSSLDVSGEEQTPAAIEFSPDGKKMFVLGYTGDDVNQYTLSTGFDISTASHDGAFDISSQETNPRGLAFNNDGTKMFLVGGSEDKVFEYTLTTPFNLIAVSGEHTGDVIDTANTSTYDTDVDVETLTVTAVRLGSSEGSGTAGTVGSALTGTYGQLTLNSNGSYTYVANQTAADNLDAGDVVTDSFNYTVSDGTATDIAVITITVIGINDAPSAQNDVGVIVEDSTLTVTNGANATLTGTYDATGENSGDLIDTSSSSHTDSDLDTSASLSITQIKKENGSNSAVASGSSYNSSGTQVTGTYGTLTIGADGSYTYAATADAADALDVGESATDVFVYTLSDGTATTTANITITILGANDAPVAANDYGAINEDATLTVADGDNQYFTANQRYDDTGEHSGDVINTTYTGTDTDVDGDTLTVSAVRTGSTEGSGTDGTVGSALTGTYGQLTLNSNGSYTYVANQAAADALDVGDTVTDSFNYTVTDGSLTDTAVIEIKVFGVNDVPVAQNDVGVINEDSTLTVSDGDNANETNDAGSTYNATGEHSGDVINTSSGTHQDSDADASATLTVTQIKKNGGSNSAVSSGTTNSNGTSVTGTYGTLTIGADGSYTYAATADAADGIADGESATDVFVYTLSDGTDTTTANITITILGQNDALTAQNDEGVIMEGSTLTVANGSNANVSGSYDATGEHSGDVLDTTSSSHKDSDPDTSDTLTITHIKKDGGSNSTVSSGSSYNSSGTAVTGAYGTLTIGADGSYKYVAQSDISGFDAGETLTDTFTYTVSDGNGSTGTANIVITLLGDDGNTNNAPVARDDVGVIVEDGTLTVTDGANANESGGSYNATGEYSGDLINTSSTTHYDTDADSDTITITQIRTSSGSNSAVSSGSSYNSNGTSVTGTYGTLTIGADGSYTYVADQAAADALDLNDSVTDTFVYTLSDDTATTTANIVITVLGINDTPVAVDDTDVVTENQTITKTGAQDDVLNDDTDADESATLTLTAIQPSGGSSSNVSSGSTYDSSGTSVTGTYGTLTIGADGSYTYTADQAAADALDDTETATDTFTYTVTDENGDTATATITITVNGANDAPVARNDTGTVEEDATLTVSDGDNANVVSAASVVDSTYVAANTQARGPQGFRFSNDGTKMFVVGNNTDAVSEYTLSTAFDVSTASFVDNFDFSSQESSPRDLAFNTDGTKMFILGVDGDDVTEYTLSTAFDASTASHVSGGEFDISSQDDFGTGLSFNGDGTKMFISGNDDDDVNEYTLSTAFDVSTASFVDSFSVSSQDSHIQGLTFNPNGTKMYLVGDQGNDINEYDLTLPFDVSTASFVGALDVSSQDTSPKAVGFNHDGTKLFVLGNDNGRVFEYTLTTPFSLINIDGEHSGDVIDTSNTSSYDTDVDVETLTVSAVRVGNSEGSGTAGTVGSALTGTYGQLTLNANGSYTYVANQSAADDLDAGDIVYDYFNYTVSDGDATDIAVITITVVGVNDTPVAVDDTDSVNEDATVTKTGSQDDALYDDTDADDSDSLTVTAIAPSGGSTSTVSEGSTYASGGTTVTGTYGILTIGADGSYTYTADQSAADDLDLNDTATDVFTYTVSDGANTTTATITITVTGINDDPVAQNDVGVILEDSTLTVANSANANVSGSYDATGEHSGDVIDTSSSSHTDSDPDDSATLTVTQIKKDGGSNSAVSSGSSYNSSGTSVTGTYGTLTIGADGSYSYAADQSAADDLDKDDQVTDVFTYTLSDGTETTTANITITVIGINDTPTAVNDTDSVTEDERVTKTAVQDDVLNDDSDVDDSAVLTVSNISHTNGNSGTVSSSTTHLTGTTIVGTYGTLTIGSNGSYTYIADQDAADSIASGSSETDVFTYTVTDENGATATATLTITVSGADNEVVGVNDTGAVDAGGTLSVTPDSAGLLSNDTDNGQAALSVGESSVTEIRTGRENRSGTSGNVGSELTGTYGTLTLNSDGTYTYVANTDAAKAIAPADTEIDYFTYTISDGTSTDTAQLAITVTGINEAPTSTSPPTIRASENQPIKFQTKIFFDDPDPSSSTYGQLTYSVSGLPFGLKINDNGRINGKLKEGTYTFTVTATDGGNLSTSQTFTIVVGKPPPMGEPPPPPVVLNKKTLETAIANKIVTFETPKTNNKVVDLEVRSSLASIVKEYTFNGGMKVIDVAVEDLNIDQSGRPGINENTILGFAIGDDYRLNVKQYTGTLEDGSELPNWIRVDPATGQTIVQFPENVYSVDVKVIAIDTDNTTREINVTLDKNSVSRDTALKRDLEPFIDRSAALKTEVTVDDKGQIILESSEDQIRDDVLNPNDSNNDDNQREDPNNQSKLDNVPVLPKIAEETPTQDNLALDAQSPDLEEKVVKFASLQDQIDLEFDEHENYGDKILKVSG